MFRRFIEEHEKFRAPGGGSVRLRSPTVALCSTVAHLASNPLSNTDLSEVYMTGVSGLGLIEQTTVKAAHVQGSRRLMARLLSAHGTAFEWDLVLSTPGVSFCPRLHAKDLLFIPCSAGICMG